MAVMLRLIMLMGVWLVFGTLAATITNVNVASIECGCSPDIEWEVEFVSAIWNDESDTTTFTYNVTSLAASECSSRPWRDGGSACKGLSHWVLIAPANLCFESCSPECSYGKDGSIKDQEVFGFKWENDDDYLLPGQTKTYTVTIMGHVEISVSSAIVKGGTYYYEYNPVFGPGSCRPQLPETHSISGHVYLDVNGNGGCRDANEMTVQYVSLSLISASTGEVLQTTVTNSDGLYIFINVADGDYYVVVNAGEGLLASEEGQYLTIQANASVTVAHEDNFLCTNDIPLGLDIPSIIDDLDPTDPDGDNITLAGNGKTIGFWKHQLSCIVNGKGRAQYDAAQMKYFMDQLALVALPLPFVVPAGTVAYRAAYCVNILVSTSSDQIDLLKKQLLGLEFNHVSSKGLGESFVYLQELIIALAENIVLNENNYWSDPARRDYVLSVKDVCDLINNTGE